MSNSYRQTFNPLTGNFDLVLSGNAVLEPNLVYDQVVYVDKSNSRTYTEDGSYDKPFKSLVSMFTNVTDASASKKYACMVAPGSYVEANTLELKPHINLISFANDTVLISKLNGTSVKWSNNNPGRLFVQGIAFTNGVEVLNDNPTGVSGMVFDLDNCELASLIFNGRGGGKDFIQLRNDTRVTGITTIKSASTTIFNSTLIGLLTLNDVGCLNPDSFGSAITATLRNNYQLNVSIATTSFDVYVDAWGNNNIGTLTIVNNSSVASTFNCDVSTYPGTISLSGSPLPVVVRTSKTEGISYTPSTPANWPVVPDDAKEALDDLASRISSSNIIVEKDNTAIVNPASVLNYEGTPFKVTDAGSGQANIKIGPEINFNPVNLASIISPVDGDIACDINAQYAIKRYNAATSSWVSNISNLVFGDVDDGLNLGTGTGIFAQKTAQNLEFKSLVAGSNVTITPGANDITISASASGNAVVETFPILNGQTNTLIKTYTDKSKTLDLTYSVNRSVLDTFAKPLNIATQTIDYFTNTVLGSVVQPDGKIIVFGGFIAFAGQTGKTNIIRLNADGTEDTTFSNNAVVSAGVAKFNSIVRSVAVQSDNKVIVAGGFTNYNATGKNYLIRLNADGTEDTSFSNNAVVSGSTAKFNQTIYKVLVQSDGKILVGGAFTNYPASAPTTGNTYFIRLNSDGTEDTVYNATANRIGSTAKFNNIVISFSIQTDLKLLIGGEFTDYPTPATPTGKSYAIRLNTDGSEDTVFTGNIVNKLNPGFGFSTLSKIEARPDGKVAIVGEFTNYGSQTGKNYFIVLNSDGTEDTAFSANAIVSGTTSKFSDYCKSVICQSDNKIVVGGYFILYDGVAKSRVLRFNSDGTEDTTFTSNAVYDGVNSFFSNYVEDLFLNTDGKIYITGEFLSSVQSINRFRILNTNGTVFNPSLLVTNKLNSGVVNVTITQPDGKLIIGGTFTDFGGQLGKSYLIRLNSDGTEDTAFTSNAVVSGVTSKFNSTGFVIRITAIAVQTDGKILLGGFFANYNGSTGKNYLIRLNSDGTEDTAFSDNAVAVSGVAKFNANIDVIKLQTDGKILIGGSFTNYNTTGKNRLIRLNSDGTEDTVFSGNAVWVSPTTPRINNQVRTIAIQSDGKILFGGSFTNYNTTGKNFLIRLNADGTEDTVFTGNAVWISPTTNRISSSINSIAIQSDGKILLGGVFQNYFATGKNRLMRLNTNGTEDTPFSANAVVNGTTPRFSSNVLSIAIQEDGKILVGGQFLNWSAGTGKSRLLRFNSDGTEDTVFTNNYVLSGTTEKFRNSVNFISIEKTRIYISGAFSNYFLPYQTNSFFAAIEEEYRVQIAKLFGIPTNVNQFSFSTPTTFGPEAGFPTGVTVTFGTDGTVKYTSTTLASSDARVDTLTIETKAL